MIQQLAITYPADYLGKESRRRRSELIADAVARLNPKEVAFTLDISATNLHDAVHGRDRKVWHDEWTGTVVHMLLATGDENCVELARNILATLLEHTPWTLTDVIELTPEEEAAALRRELLKFGDAGKQAVDRVTKRKARR